MGVVFSDYASVDPISVWKYCRERDWPINNWFGKPNSYWCPRGIHSGKGWLLMPWDHIHSIDAGGRLNQPQTLHFRYGSDEVTLHNLVYVSAKAITPGLRDDPNGAFLVELADVRRVYRQIPINTSYNVRSAGNEYLPPTLDVGVPWTWAGMIGDIWDTIGKLGSFAGLPFSPNGVPEGFEFFGWSALEALGAVLAKLDMTLVFDPLAGSNPFSIVSIGDPNSPVDAEEAKYDKYRLWDDYELEGVLANYWPNVRVFFRRIPAPTDGAPAFDERDVADLEPLDGGDPATYGILFDDMYALYDDDGNLTNGAELTARAEERAEKYYQHFHGSDLMHKILPAPVDDRGLLPGSRIKGILWYDRGAGYKTEVIRERDPADPRFISPPPRFPITLQDELDWAITTTLDGGIDATQDTLDVNDAGKFPSEFRFIILIGTEEILVGGGFGTNNWTDLIRGWNSTTPATHADTATVTLVQPDVVKDVRRITYALRGLVTPGDCSEVNDREGIIVNMVAPINIASGPDGAGFFTGTRLKYDPDAETITDDTNILGVDLNQF